MKGVTGGAGVIWVSVLVRYYCVSVTSLGSVLQEDVLVLTGSVLRGLGVSVMMFAVHPPTVQQKYESVYVEP